MAPRSRWASGFSRLLRSPSAWIVVVLLVIAIAATATVGIELFSATESAQPYNNR